MPGTCLGFLSNSPSIKHHHHLSQGHACCTCMPLDIRGLLQAIQILGFPLLSTLSVFFFFLFSFFFLSFFLPPPPSPSFFFFSFVCLFVCFFLLGKIVCPDFFRLSNFCFVFTYCHFDKFSVSSVLRWDFGF